MKITFVVMLNLIIQNMLNPEDLIGKEIDFSFVKEFKLSLEEESGDEKLYSINDMKFLDQTCRSFFIRTKKI